MLKYGVLYVEIILDICFIKIWKEIFSYIYLEIYVVFLGYIWK